ncbi:hypothetical protein [Streptomyces sp. NPDC046759]|uniref:hypothetical protein n=1 Tax=Streptomyces sp. NPDC046759 TaxID=3155019 RepID=UPI0033C23706
MFAALGALAGPAHAVAGGSLPTATTAVVDAAVHTAVHDGTLSGLLPGDFYRATHVGDEDIHWD